MVPQLSKPTKWHEMLIGDKPTKESPYHTMKYQESDLGVDLARSAEAKPDSNHVGHG
jgi:hypothetical protein